jgi:PAS domain S-box-containing protein
MLQTLVRWFSEPSGLTPHGFCLLWQPGLIWTYAISDAAIALAYFTIPIALVIVLRHRSDLAFRSMFWLFAAFILLCGTTHAFDVLTLWVPAYGLEGLVKAATAIVSVVTAITLSWILPKALAWPSPAQLRAVNAALSASQVRYRTGFERSPVPLHILDQDHVIIDVSQSWLDLLGYARGAVIGRRITEFHSPDSQFWTEADWAAFTEAGEARSLKRRLVREDGEVIDVLVSARLEFQNDVERIICTVIDVSQRRRAEEALRISEERLRQSQKMEAVGQLTGGIAHDFNNILQGVSGSLELMGRRLEQGRIEDTLRYLETARHAVDRAASLTHRMLAFARRQALQPRPIDPDSLVRGMAELIGRTMGPEILLELRLGQGVWKTFCDPNHLESALLNLAINARDAMRNGGVLTIASSNRILTSEDLADQNGVAPGDFVEMAVGDTGTGMTADILAHAFEPFYTTKPLGQGTGLGLSQVYGFVQQSGGFVRLESAPDRGTTVRLYLSRHEAAETDAPDHVLAGHPAGLHGAALSDVAGRCVLVVDDEAAVRALIAEALRDLGCEVMEAVDGRAGLRALQSAAQLDLLITDVGLPDVNGREIVEAARAERPSLPVLIVTGYAGTALDNVQLASGIEVMRKPFGLDTLAAQVATMLAWRDALVPARSRTELETRPHDV